MGLMLSGKIFRLTTGTLAIENIDGERIAISLPRGAIVHVIRGPSATDARMVDVRWLDRRLAMFDIDLHGRGEEVLEDSVAPISELDSRTQKQRNDALVNTTC